MNNEKPGDSRAFSLRGLETASSVAVYHPVVNGGSYFPSSTCGGGDPLPPLVYQLSPDLLVTDPSEP